MKKKVEMKYSISVPLAVILTWIFEMILPELSTQHTIAGADSVCADTPESCSKF